ncbi:MAG: UvrD-helicase domain-containing protein [bacterium]|nr:UvrD-helicase domain-containing protein [bacterium]
MSELASLVRGDAEARSASQAVFDRPVIVEAGAGTGKTTILVARILSWALGPGWEEARAELEVQQTEKLKRKGKSFPPEQLVPPEETIAARALEGIVAITFTEAAAAEMASRVAERLADIATGKTVWAGFDPGLIAGAPDAKLLSERARALLGQLDRLTASTIHAFCHALLRRHPLEAGLHPDFTIDARGERTEEIVRSVVESRIKRAYMEAGFEAEPGESGDSPLLELAAYGKSPQAIVDALWAFILEGVPAAGLETDPFHPELVDGVSRELLEDFERLLDVAGGDLSHIKRTTNPARVEKALEMSVALLQQAEKEGVTGLDGARAICAALRSTWVDSAWKHFKQWGKGRFGKGEQATLGERTSELADIAARLVPRISYLRSARPEFLDAARRAILPLLQEVEREARASGVVTFQALLREAWHLLREHRRILERERRGIRQLLVDEFQDTDRLQCDIVELLALPKQKAATNGAEAAEPGSRPAPGLFIVGDPKQSIYGWRNADLESYNRLVGMALRAGGERYSLVQNFRSHSVVLAEVERAVSPVMTEEDGLQPAFEPLVAATEAADADLQAANPEQPWSPVEYWVSWHPDWKAKTRHAEAAEIEARAIARDIRRLHAAGTRWKECALLMRNASRLDTYLDGFRDAGVPFIVTSDKQYFRRREVIDASALIRCVVSPADHVALLTWLRSPIVGVPDAALIPLWSRGFPRLLTELDGEARSDTLAQIEAVVEEAASVTPEVPGIDRIRGWDRLLLHSLRALAALRRSFKNEPADRFMEHLRWAFLSEAIEGARYLGRYRVANLERLFRSIETGLETRGGDVRAVLRALRRSVSMALDAEEALPQDAAEDAVQVMTIHKAKGLEFGHVYLAQLHARGRSSERSEFDSDRRWDGFQQLEYVLFDAQTLGFDSVERHRERVSAAEQVRTLYVAMTRAKRRIVMLGNWPETPTRSRGGAPTYVELLSHRDGQPDSLTELARDATQRPEGLLDAAGVCWKFPGLSRASEPTAPPATTGALPSPARVAETSKQLTADREAAGRRQQRPFLATASLGFDDKRQLESPDGKPPPYSRAAALAIGKAVHRALESWNLDADLEEERRVQSGRAERYLASLLSGADLEAGRKELAEVLARLQSGQLLERLLSAPTTVVARELPILLPPTGIDESEPVAGISGTVDLVLKAPDGAYTVVDFKTDRIESEEELRSRAQAYAPQLSTYARAVGESLGLDARPSTELWFLWPDRVWPVS